MHVSEGRLVGINGLYGCTAVIIISDRGVFLSHIWEDPGFVTAGRLIPVNTFVTNTMNLLRTGTFTFSRNLNALKGTRSRPGPLARKYHPRILIISPGLAGTRRLHYAAHVNALAAKLATFLSSTKRTPITKRGYIRAPAPIATNPSGLLGRFVIEIDPAQHYTIASRRRNEYYQWGGYRLWIDGISQYEGEFYTAKVKRRVRAKRGAQTASCDLATVFSDRPDEDAPAEADESAAAPTSPRQSAPAKPTV